MAEDRRPAYSEVLASLLALRPDPATLRFDTVLSELLAQDRIDPEAARELRWWQRESVRSVGDYLGDTAPALLVALESSRQTAEDAAAAAARAWEQATRPQAPQPAADPRPAADPPTTTRGTDVVVDLRGTRRAGPDQAPPGDSTDPGQPGPTPPPAPPSARVTAAPAPTEGPSTVASPTRRLLITGRSVHPSTAASGRAGRPRA